MIISVTDCLHRRSIGGLGRTTVEFVSAAPPPTNTLPMPISAPLGGLGGVKSSLSGASPISPRLTGMREYCWMSEAVKRENDFLKQVHQLHHLTPKPYILSKKTHGGAAPAFSTLIPPQAHQSKRSRFSEMMMAGEVKSSGESKTDNGVGCHAHNRVFKGGIKTPCIIIKNPVPNKHGIQIG